MTFALIVFAASLLGIAILFSVKYWEMRRGRVFLSRWRALADVRASELKELLAALQIDLAKLPPFTVHLFRIIVHEAALGFAATARLVERQAHRLADFVSYKHRFEKRETRSEFLRKMSEHKNGGGDALDEGK